MARGKTTILVAMALTALVCTSVAFSQGGLNRGPGRPLTPEEEKQQKEIMEKYQKQVSKQSQEFLGATDEEWKVLEPKYNKVQTLSTLAQYGSSIVYFGAPPSDQSASETDLQKATAELGKLLKNKDVKTEDIKAALETYRKARAKIKEDLEKARKELKELLTGKQEAQLVLRGLLE